MVSNVIVVTKRNASMAAEEPMIVLGVCVSPSGAREMVVADIDGDDALTQPSARIAFEQEPGTSHFTYELDDEISYHYEHFDLGD